MTHAVIGLRRVALLFAAMMLATIFLPATARAQCTKDTDCKGDRVCRQGACEEPLPAQTAPVPGGAAYPPAGPMAAPGVPPAPPSANSAPVPPAPSPGAPPAYYAPPPGYYAPPAAPYGAPPSGYAPTAAGTQPAVRADPGWAAGAATYGIISGAAVLALAIGAEATKADVIPAAPLGGVATALFAASVPIVAIGGSSARNHPAVNGSTGLRIAGWIAYGVALADAAYLLSQVGQSEPADGLILSVGLLGAASMACFVIDARLAVAEANRVMESGMRAKGGARSGILTPIVLRDHARPGRLAAGLGWVSLF